MSLRAAGALGVNRKAEELLSKTEPKIDRGGDCTPEMRVAGGRLFPVGEVSHPSSKKNKCDRYERL
jgi:hypothetical protein